MLHHVNDVCPKFSWSTLKILYGCAWCRRRFEDYLVSRRNVYWWKTGRCYTAIYAQRCAPFIRCCCFVRHPKKISNYTDNHDVDESVMAISMHSGYWVDHTFAGITHRDMGGTSSYVSSHVAYKYNKNSTLITGVEFYMICLNLWICQITEE